MFIPFPMELNNKLVQFFQREKRHKEIYEASGGYGQQSPLAPSMDQSMTDSSDISGTVQDNIEEEVVIIKSPKH